MLRRTLFGDTIRAGADVVLPNTETTKEEAKGFLPLHESGSYIEGPVRIIRTSVAWQNSYTPTCKHLTIVAAPSTPPTAKVSVVAKVSLFEDQHLEREAKNYQSFPRHMFEQWSGFNKLPSLADPTPLRTLIPQFYGYYEPADPPPDKYLSPILLMEYCGREVSPETLTNDEK